jgi:hypothetical protein
MEKSVQEAIPFYWITCLDVTINTSIFFTSPSRSPVQHDDFCLLRHFQLITTSLHLQFNMMIYVYYVNALELVGGYNHFSFSVIISQTSTLSSLPRFHKIIDKIPTYFLASMPLVHLSHLGE